MFWWVDAVAEQFDSLFRLRVRYVKQGRLRYLSHLEVLRACERMVRRAGLPVAVTQGFSPHMRLAFGPALPCGVASRDEWFDIILTDYVPAAQALGSLAKASVPDLGPQEAAYVDMRADSLSAALTIARWQALFISADGWDEADAETFAQDMAQAVRALADQGEIRYLRNGKEKSISLADTVVAAPEVLSAGPQGLLMAFTTRSSNAGSLRPDVLCQELLRLCPPHEAAERVRRAAQPQKDVSSSAESGVRVHIERLAQSVESEDGTWQRPI